MLFSLFFSIKFEIGGFENHEIQKVWPKVTNFDTIQTYLVHAVPVGLLYLGVKWFCKIRCTCSCDACDI